MVQQSIEAIARLEWLRQAEMYIEMAGRVGSFYAIAERLAKYPVWLMIDEEQQVQEYPASAMRSILADALERPGFDNRPPAITYMIAEPLSEKLGFTPDNSLALVVYRGTHNYAIMPFRPKGENDDG